MRPVPPDVAALIRAIPADFRPAFEVKANGRYVQWSALLPIKDAAPIRIELGYSRASGKADEAKESANLRASAWQATELARLGRVDLLSYCLTTRHKRSA